MVPETTSTTTVSQRAKCRWSSVIEQVAVVSSCRLQVWNPWAGTSASTTAILDRSGLYCWGSRSQDHPRNSRRTRVDARNPGQDLQKQSHPRPQRRTALSRPLCGGAMSSKWTSRIVGSLCGTPHKVVSASGSGGSNFVVPKTMAASHGMAQRCTHASVGNPANQAYLLHGTNPTSAVAILSNSFTVDFAGRVQEQCSDQASIWPRAQPKQTSMPEMMLVENMTACMHCWFAKQCWANPMSQSSQVTFESLCWMVSLAMSWETGRRQLALSGVHFLSWCLHLPRVCRLLPQGEGWQDYAPARARNCSASHGNGRPRFIRRIHQIFHPTQKLHKGPTSKDSKRDAVMSMAIVNSCCAQVGAYN